MGTLEGKVVLAEFWHSRDSHSRCSHSALQSARCIIGLRWKREGMHAASAWQLPESGSALATLSFSSTPKRARAGAVPGAEEEKPSHYGADVAVAEWNVRRPVS